MNADLWAQLFFDNRDFLAEEIDALCVRLAEYSRTLRAGDEDKLRSLLQEGNDWKKRSEKAL